MFIDPGVYVINMFCIEINTIMIKMFFVTFKTLLLDDDDDSDFISMSRSLSKDSSLSSASQMQRNNFHRDRKDDYSESPTCQKTKLNTCPNNRRGSDQDYQYSAVAGKGSGPSLPLPLPPPSSGLARGGGRNTDISTRPLPDPSRHKANEGYSLYKGSNERDNDTGMYWYEY